MGMKGGEMRSGPWREREQRHTGRDRDTHGWGDKEMGQRLGDSQREADGETETETAKQEQTEDKRPRDAERDRQEERTGDRDGRRKRRPGWDEIKHTPASKAAAGKVPSAAAAPSALPRSAPASVHQCICAHMGHTHTHTHTHHAESHPCPPHPGSCPSLPVLLCAICIRNCCAGEHLPP